MSDTLSSATPESVGMDPTRLERAGDLLKEAVQARRMTAASLVVARSGATVYEEGFGKRRPIGDSPDVGPGDVFLLASISKPITVCALMILVDRGLVSLNDPVSLYLPEFDGRDRSQIRVRYLLSHISGLPDMLPENVELRRAHAPLSEFVRRTTRTPLLYAPNTDFAYQSTGTLLAGEIVERVTGERLRDFQDREIFQALGMRRSALGLGTFEIEDTVWCGVQMDETEDQQRFGANSPYWRDMGHPWGGTHSTGQDLSILLQAFLNEGRYGGRRLLSRASVETMTTDQNTHLNAPWGLGWGLTRSRVWNYFGEIASRNTFGHTGSTGTVAWADPDEQLTCVLLTNQMVDRGSLLRRVSNLVSSSVVA